MSKKKREISIAIAFGTQNDLILFLRQWWVFCVNILHDGRNLFWVHYTGMLEPYNLTVNATVITIWPQCLCNFLQDIEILYFHSFRLSFMVFSRIKRGGKPNYIVFPIFPQSKQISWQETIILNINFPIVDNSPAGKEDMYFHQPSRIIRDILSYG